MPHDTSAAQAEPAGDSATLVAGFIEQLTKPQAPDDMANNLMYAVVLMRIVGEVEGSAAVHRAGTGKIHRRPDQRADDTSHHFLLWMLRGAASQETAVSVAKVQALHDHYAKSYSFSNESYLHSIALFTIMFDELFTLVGVKGGLSGEQKAAQVEHWRTIGGYMGIRDMPDTWAGMQGVVREYEQNPQWYRATAEGHRCAESLIDQFNNRFVPRPLHPVGRAMLLSLQPDHVLAVISEPKPPAPVVWSFRRVVQAGLLIQLKVVPRIRALRRRREP